MIISLPFAEPLEEYDVEGLTQASFFLNFQDCH